MSVPNGDRTVTKQDLADFYGEILPYLGGMPSLEYSTEEKVVGKWITGDILYQKTVPTGGEVPSGATLIQRETQTGYDTLRYIKS